MPYIPDLGGFIISPSSGGGGGQNQTPWLSDIDADGFSLNNALNLSGDLSNTTLGLNGNLIDLFNGAGQVNSAVFASASISSESVYDSFDDIAIHNITDGDSLTGIATTNAAGDTFISFTASKYFGDGSELTNLNITQLGISPIADGTYTVGFGVTNNGTITTQDGVITAIQEAS